MTIRSIISVDVKRCKDDLFNDDTICPTLIVRQDNDDLTF